MEHAPAFSDRVTRRICRDQQHGQAVCVRLPEGRAGISDTRPRDHQCDTGLSSCARPPFCHKSRTLFIAGLDMTNTLIEAPAEVERVHARDTEHRTHPISF